MKTKKSIILVLIISAAADLVAVSGNSAADRTKKETAAPAQKVVRAVRTDDHGLGPDIQRFHPVCGPPMEINSTGMGFAKRPEPVHFPETIAGIMGQNLKTTPASP